MKKRAKYLKLIRGGVDLIYFIGAVFTLAFVMISINELSIPHWVDKSVNYKPIIFTFIVSILLFCLGRVISYLYLPKKKYRKSTSTYLSGGSGDSGCGGDGGCAN